MKDIFFFIRRFNDYDTTAPYIFYLSKLKKYRITVLCSDPFYDFKKENITIFLNSFSNIRFLYHYEIFFQKNISFFLKVFFKIATKLNMRRYLSQYFNRDFSFNLYSFNLKAVFIDLPNKRNFGMNKIIQLIKKNKIPLIGIRHGLRLWNLKDKYHLENTINANNEFDKILVAYKKYKSALDKINKNKTKIINFGSLRYSKKWQKINLKINNKYKLEKKSKLNILYFDHAKEYNMNGDKIYNTLKKISELKDIELLIKPNTSNINRGITFALSSDKLKKINSMTSLNSVKLISWADVVLCPFSTIIMEAFLQKKIVISPTYFHNNDVLWEKIGATINVKNEKDLIHLILSIKKKKNFIKNNEFAVNKLLKLITNGIDKKNISNDIEKVFLNI